MNLLATERSRRRLFALLYLCEGAPIGFLWWTLNTILREQGVGQSEIYVFDNQGALAFQPRAVTIGENPNNVLVRDIDNDGKSDILLVNNNGPTRLLHNRSPNTNHWLGLRLRLSEGGRDAYGAQVTVLREHGSALLRRVGSDGSYLSSRDPRILFGLGPDPALVGVRVRWSRGDVEEWQGLELGRYHTLIRGQGRPAAELPDFRAATDPSATTGS